MKILILTLAMTVGGSAAFAGGTETGSGGSLIILPNNEIVLADPFVKKTDVPGVGERWVFREELKNYLLHIQDLLDRYGISKNENLDFWTKRVFADTVEYRYTENLPCDDPMVVQDNTPGTVVTFGCTQGNITWFKKSLFEQLNLKQQALAIIHERLHSFTPEIHEVISDFISILQMMLTLQNDQLQGNLRQLTDDEVKAIERMRYRAEQMGFRVIANTNLVSYRILPNGGGVLKLEMDVVFSTPLGRNLHWRDKSVVSPEAFLGIGTLVMHDSIASQGDILLNSWIEGTEISENVKMTNVISVNPYDNSPDYHFRILSNVIMNNVSLMRLLNLEIKNGASLTNVALRGDYSWPKVYIEDNVILQNLDLELVGDPFELENMLIIPLVIKFFSDRNQAGVVFTKSSHIKADEKLVLRLDLNSHGWYYHVSSIDDLKKLKE